MFKLSDDDVEDAIYVSYAIRKYVGIDFMPVLNAIMLIYFSNLIEKSRLSKAYFEIINCCLRNADMMRGDTIVDETICRSSGAFLPQNRSLTEEFNV